MKFISTGICVLLYLFSKGAEPSNENYVFFPSPSEKKFNLSAGMIFTTTNKEVTEEKHFRIPAFDFNSTLKVAGEFNFSGRIQSQIIQNHVAIGVHWVHPLSERVSIGLSDDIAFWAGKLKTDGFNTKAYGWLNYPGISVGKLFGQDVLVTLKAEAILNLAYHSYVGSIPASSEKRFFSGEAITLVLEQPFYKDKWFVLGFSAMYVNYFWQVWPLFEPFDRNTFYPQIIMGFML